MNIRKGTYRHFKGGIYEVVDIALHSETLEEMVVYKNAESGKCWVRPASMWDEKVEFEGKIISRFTFIEK